MPKLKDIILGLKGSALVSLLLGFVTISIYALALAIHTVFHGEEYIGVRLLFLAGFFTLATFVTAHQTGKTFKDYLNDTEVDLENTYLSIQILIIGGIGITFILLSIYDLLNTHVSRSLIESPIGVSIVMAAVQLWLAKTPRWEQHKLQKGPGVIILFYILFLAALAPISGLAIYWLYPGAAQEWMYWITFFLPATAGAWYVFRIPTSPRSKKLR